MEGIKGIQMAIQVVKVMCHIFWNTLLAEVNLDCENSRVDGIAL